MDAFECKLVTLHPNQRNILQQLRHVSFFIDTDGKAERRNIRKDGQTHRRIDR